MITLGDLETLCGDMISHGVPGNTPVLVARDPEGNGFMTSKDMEVYWDEENDFTDVNEGQTVIVLWP